MTTTTTGPLPQISANVSSQIDEIINALSSGKRVWGCGIGCAFYTAMDGSTHFGLDFLDSDGEDNAVDFLTARDAAWEMVKRTSGRFCFYVSGLPED